MKNMIKKVMGAVMAVALFMGVLVTQTDTVQAGNKAFDNKGCKPLTESDKSIETDGDAKIGGCFHVLPWFVEGSHYAQLDAFETTVKQGTVIYASIPLTPHASVKSTSIKSSNKKVIKATNKKKGAFKAAKNGTATISYKVVFSTSDKMSESYKDQYRKVTKKGNTYTATMKLKVKVVCKSHKYGAWVTKKAASCEEEGEKQKKCSKCGDKVTKEISETGHKYDNATHKCTVCGQADPGNDEEEE